MLPVLFPQVPDGVLLSTAALQPIIPKVSYLPHVHQSPTPPLFATPTPPCPDPQLARILPGSLPLQLHVRVGSKPVVTIRDGRATTTLKATIDVVSPALQSASLFSLDTVSGLSGDEASETG